MNLFLIGVSKYAITPAPNICIGSSFYEIAWIYFVDVIIQRWELNSQRSNLNFRVFRYNEGYAYILLSHIPGSPLIDFLRKLT